MSLAGYPFYNFIFDTEDYPSNPSYIHRGPGGKGGSQAVAGNGSAQTRAQSAAASSSPSLPHVDLYDKPEQYELVASVPGLSTDQINIEFDTETRYLTISGEVADSSEGEDKQYLKWKERWHGEFSRSVKIPAKPRIKEEEIKAKINNGVLKIVIPKETEQPQKKEKRKITISNEETA